MAWARMRLSVSAAPPGGKFTIQRIGRSGQAGWASAQDGLLVRDINGDGLINDGRELFGGATELANGQRAGDGFRAMAALDSNGDGKLSASDKAFGELKLWVDANSDGITDAGELKGLLEMGVAELNLDFSKGRDLNNGNLMGLVGNYTKTDGSEAAMVDVWFAKQPATPPSAAELLSGPSVDLLAGGAGGYGSAGVAGNSITQTVAPAAAAVGGAGLMSRAMVDDELLRNSVPLI